MNKRILISIIALVVPLIFDVGMAQQKPISEKNSTIDQPRMEKVSMGILHLYGPGGPLGPMEECGNAFSERTGTSIKITTGIPHQWIEQAKQKGELIFEGAEYMLNDFMRTYPGIVDESSITGLFARSTSILVRKGNPKNIRALSDLAKDGIRVLTVTQEKMEEVYGHIPGIQYNLVTSVLTGAMAARTWKTTPDLDAWITYESWHYALKDQTERVQISDRERVFRITPIAVIRTSKNMESVKEFVNFLKSDEAHKIFQKWGWK